MAALRPLPSRRANLAIVAGCTALAAAALSPAIAATAAPILRLPYAGTSVARPALRTCAARTRSGLGYTVLRRGSAAHPRPSDAVLINYLGYLRGDGKVFDQNRNSALAVMGTVPGFAEGLQLMGKGGVYRLCIPAAQGYGATARGPIPANADLVFQVELLDFRPLAAAPR